MDSFRVAVSNDADFQVAAESCARQLGRAAGGEALGFLYISDRYGDAFDQVREHLQAATGIHDWVGSFATGVFAVTGAQQAWEINHQPGVVAARVSLPPDSFRLIDAGDLLPTGDAAAFAHGQAYPVAIVHADAHQPKAMQQVSELAEHSGSFLIGGLASTGQPLPRAHSPFVDSAICGAMFRPSVGVQIGLTQGCAPLGPVRMITEGHDYLIMSIDGRPALDVLCEDIGEEWSNELPQVGPNIHLAFPLTHSDRPDYLVRNLVGIDPTRRWLAVGAHVTSGEPLMVVRRGAAGALADLEVMVRGLAGRLGGRPPRGGLYFSCVARGEHLFGRPGDELAVIGQTLGPMPLAGFACGGEICNGRLYGYTGVLAVFT